MDGGRAALRFGADVPAGEASAVERSAADVSGEASALPLPLSFVTLEVPNVCKGFSPQLRISLGCPESKRSDP